jgi:CBS domain-containing protein
LRVGRAATVVETVGGFFILCHFLPSHRHSHASAKYENMTEPDNLLRGVFMKAKDLMVAMQDYLRPDNTLKEAVNILRTAVRGEQRMGVMGSPVLDENGNLVGMLSTTDILRAVYPAYMTMMNLGDFTWDGMLESLACQAGDKKVGDIMTRKVITVVEDDPLMECVDHMLKGHVRRMPVLDKGGKMVGMIYLRDIFYAVTQSMMDERCKL